MACICLFFMTELRKHPTSTRPKESFVEVVEEEGFAHSDVVNVERTPRMSTSSFKETI